MVMCMFANIAPQMQVDLINAACGYDWTVGEMMTAGERGWNMKRAINNFGNEAKAAFAEHNGKLNAAKDEAPAGNQPVNVVADTHTGQGTLHAVYSSCGCCSARS